MVKKLFFGYLEVKYALYQLIMLICPKGRGVMIVISSANCSGLAILCGIRLLDGS